MSSPKRTISGPHMGAQVHYALAVIDAATGRKVSRWNRRRNLILDSGLDRVATMAWAAIFTHAVIGTGTTPTKRDSGAVTFTRSGAVVTASAGFFVADDVGRLLKLDSGEEMYVTAYTSATEVTVSTSGALDASEGTIWYVNQTGLTAETKRTNTYDTSGGANGTTFAGNAATMKRTFMFSAEAATVTYREIGWSHTATAGNNLFGRDLLAGAGVTLTAGQILKVVVELSITFGPQPAAAWSPVISGWTQSGQIAWEQFQQFPVQDNGGVPGGGQDAMGMHANKSVALAISSAALAAFSNGNTSYPAISQNTVVPAAYVLGSFYRTWTTTFGVVQGNSAAIRSIIIGAATGSNILSGVRVLLAAAETKDSDHTLSVTFAFSWGRILVN